MHLLIALLISSISLSTVVEHDIHLSVTEISTTDDGIEVLTKIFFDDLQTSMGLVPGEELPDDYSNAEDIISAFVNKNLILTLNDKRLVMEIKEIEPSLPAVWTTLTIKDVELKDINTLDITNTIMTDLFNDQKNIIKINWTKTKTDFSLDSHKTNRTIEL